ncbi:MAG: hypothetical protein HN576_11185 [Bacteriovoracaceae bacterium]|jgi:hypothetical protein|nr:hypothetical protein [Bacteriovoracaceae bacterium]
MKFKRLLTTLLLMSFNAFALDMSNVGVFTRCYSHITQKFPPSNLSQLNAVKNGLDPITACLQIFDMANFAKNTSMLTNTNNQTAKDVLKTMHNLHYSWFDTNFFPEIQNQIIRNTGNVFDTSAPAAYFTKALFDAASPVTNVLAGTTSYRLIRANNNPTNSPWNNIPLGDYIFTNVNFAGTGELLGMEVTAVNDTMNFTFDENQNPPESIISGTLTYNRHFGGGVLGLQPYLLQSVQSTVLNPSPDGGVKTHRKWSRAVFNDILCRELPVVREVDGDPFVSSTSSITFRNSAACVKCHTSMDRMAGVVRGVQYTERAGKFFNLGHSAFIKQRTIDKPDADIFPIEPDIDFGKRPTKGRLYYRTHNGVLVNKAVINIQDLADQIIAEDAMFVCMAKRYYKFFTGIDVDVGDIGDPNHVYLTAEEVAVRDIVIDLGRDLKKHKNPRLLIEDILRRPEYKKSNSNVGGFL